MQFKKSRLTISEKCGQLRRRWYNGNDNNNNWIINNSYWNFSYLLSIGEDYDDLTVIVGSGREQLVAFD